MKEKTILTDFNKQLIICKEIFEKKYYDYGASWSLMRVSSLIDQLFIKAQRIRNIQIKKEQKIQDNESVEFIGLVNYSIMTLISLKEKDVLNPKSSWEEVEKLYDKEVKNCIELLLQKNHDYDEAWRSMRVSSITDIILTKIYRLKQIEEHGVQFSEGLDSNLQDIFNYSIFCLILLEERKINDFN